MNYPSSSTLKFNTCQQANWTLVKIIKAHQVIITDSKLQPWTKAIYHNWLTGTKLLTVDWLVKILILFLKAAQISNFGITHFITSHNLSITSILEPHERYKWIEFSLWTTVQYIHCYCRVPFFEGYKFCEWSKNRKVEETIFTNLRWCLLFSLQYVCVTIEFSLIFGEINFMKISKIHKICKICSPWKKVPYGNCLLRIHIVFHHTYSPNKIGA